jgi:hypothetical protein
MKITHQAIIVAALLLVSSGIAGAQGHASHYAGTRAVTRHSSSGAHTGTHGSTSSTRGATTSNDMVLDGDSGLTLQDLLNPVPGLGFDYEHLAAINSNLSVRALIDPVTQLRLAQAERLLRDSGGVTPVFLGGYGGYGDYGDYGSQPAEAQQPQPQIIVLQQPAPKPAPQVEEAPALEPAAAPAPAESRPDADQFILVLRDGSRITAVAFSRQDSRIVYITPEGNRRSLAISGLDAAATIRVNEERGTSLQLPI